MTLTRRQNEVLHYLRQRREAGLDAPTLDELCDAMGTQSRGSMHKHVSALVERGFVKPNDGRRRGVLLAHTSEDDTVPVLGDIAAGAPLTSVEIDDRVTVPPSMRRSKQTYAIRVRGDSMRDAGILDGDLAIINPVDKVRDGSIVAVLIDNQEVTLKELARDGDFVELRPANPNYPTRRYSAERVAIQGVLSGILRDY